MTTTFKKATAYAFAALFLVGCGLSPPEAIENLSGSLMPGTGSDAGAAGRVEYLVEFTSRWNKANFPYGYPDTSPIHRPHFSGWIGTGHDADYRLFREDAVSSPGLEALAESGEHRPLDREIVAAVAAGHATALARSEPLRDFSRQARFTITVDPRHPWASAVSMIVPSPDWFAAFDVSLMDNGAWIERKTVEVMAWDAGSDEGLHHFAEDRESDPKMPITPISTMQFRKDGRVVPVGTVTFIKR